MAVVPLPDHVNGLTDVTLRRGRAFAYWTVSPGESYLVLPDGDGDGVAFIPVDGS